jgi:hypothetical protein
MSLCQSLLQRCLSNNFLPNRTTHKPSISLPSASPSFAPSASPSFAPSASPSFAPSASPSFAPSASPSFAPSASPSAAHPVVFGFGVKFGDEGILNSGKAILVDYLRDAKRGDTFTFIAFPFSSHSTVPLPLCFCCFCFRKDASHLSYRQLLSSLLSFRPSLVL